MCLYMRSRKKSTPEFVTKGVDILVDKIVEITDGLNRTTYTVRTSPTTEYPLSRYLMHKEPYFLESYTEEEVAEVISRYVNDIKKEYSFPDFSYKVKVNGRKREIQTASSETHTDGLKTVSIVTTKTITTKFTDEECEIVAKSIEDLLK